MANACRRARVTAAVGTWCARCVTTHRRCCESGERRRLEPLGCTGGRQWQGMEFEYCTCLSAVGIACLGGTVAWLSGVQREVGALLPRFDSSCNQAQPGRQG